MFLVLVFSVNRQYNGEKWVNVVNFAKGGVKDAVR